MNDYHVIINRSSSYSKYSSYKDSSFDESYEEDFSNSFSYNSSKSFNNSGSGGKVALASLKYVDT